MVRRAFWRGFSACAADTALPVPSIRVVQDHGTVEIMRGCPNACRFCHATVLYRPARLKDPELIGREVQVLVERAGYRQVTLSSLSSGDFRGIHGLVRELNARYAPRKVSFSLPSLRVDSLALGLLQEISEVQEERIDVRRGDGDPGMAARGAKDSGAGQGDRLAQGGEGAGLEGGEVLFHGGAAPLVRPGRGNADRRVPARRARGDGHEPERECRPLHPQTAYPLAARGPDR